MPKPALIRTFPLKSHRIQTCTQTPLRSSHETRPPSPCLPGRQLVQTCPSLFGADRRQAEEDRSEQRGEPESGWNRQGDQWEGSSGRIEGQGKSRGRGRHGSQGESQTALLDPLAKARMTDVEADCVLVV
jgi:hypothetical protein